MKKPSLVFHVIGFKAVGLGHIYRSLSLAQDLTDFQISFACTKSSYEMVELMIKEKYQLHLFDEETVYSDIRDLNPDIVINDVLSTNEEDIKTLKASSIKVVNFEDLGTGSALTDLTINELYEKPADSSKNILW
jgi:spore coat polysaccharide biosynthesis predicted glycosyltransferase SpsG